MMEMVNGSRFGVAMMGLGIARRGFLEAAVWAHHRRAKGRLLVDLPARARAARRPARRARGRRSPSASSAPPPAARPDGERLRRILVPAAKVRLCRLGVEAAVVRRRAARRQRLLRGLGPHPPAPRRAVPPDLGGQREHLRPRRAARDPARRRPRGGATPGSTRRSPAAGDAPDVPGGGGRSPSPRAATGSSAASTSCPHSTPTAPRPAPARLTELLAATVSAALLLEQACRRRAQGPGGAALRPPSPRARRDVGRPHRRGRGAGAARLQRPRLGHRREGSCLAPRRAAQYP